MYSFVSIGTFVRSPSNTRALDRLAPEGTTHTAITLVKDIDGEYNYEASAIAYKAAAAIGTILHEANIDGEDLGAAGPAAGAMFQAIFIKLS